MNRRRPTAPRTSRTRTMRRVVVAVAISVVVIAAATGVAGAQTATPAGASASPDAAAGARTAAPTTAQTADLTGVTAASIDAYLAAVSSPLAGQGNTFMTAGLQERIDPRLLVAIAGAESSFGSITCGPFNAWGYGCPNHPFQFASWGDAITTIAHGLRENYLNEGRTSVVLIQQKWAPSGASNDPTGLNNYWVANVTRFLEQQGGDASRIDLSPDAVMQLATGTPGALAGAGAVAGPEFAASTAAGDDGGEVPVASPSTPARLLVKVHNGGTTTWTAANVRLRRVDTEPHLASAPWGTLVERSVKPDADATFQIDLAAAGTAVGTWPTAWRVEGPTGPFGDEITRQVSVRRSDAAAALDSLEAPRGVVARGDVARIIVRLRNVGTTTWHRTGDSAVALGLQASTGPQRFVTGSWTSPSVPAQLLQREVAPGEIGTFAFVLATDAAQAGTSTLQLAPFGSGGWIDAEPINVSITSS